MSNYLDSLFDLEGKVAVIIGGTGELCGAMAEGLAQAGVTVVLVGRSLEKAQARIATIEAKGGKAYFETVDLGSKAAFKGLLDTVVEKSGTVDILINGAGTNSATPFLEISEEEYDSIFEINTKAIFLACQIFGAYFVERNQGGSIINIGSMTGVKPLSRVFTYSSSKAAVHNLSMNLAREWAPLNIRVNTMIPGFFPAEQNRKVLNESRIAQIMGHTPMKRFGEAQELVGATLLLASGKAGSFMTGAEIFVDGGYAAMTI